MFSNNFNALLALSLQYQSTLKPVDIRAYLETLDFSSVSSITDIKVQFEEFGRSDMFPEEKSWNLAMNTLDKSNELGIQCISISSDLYPKDLKSIDNPPNVLHVRGDFEVFNKFPGVAVVGTRKLTPNGYKIAHRIASYIAEQDWTVVSGLALGADAAAHEGALSTGIKGSTVAVLAHGLESAKPASNKKLADRILDSGGAWISEHPIGTPARPPQFVARNRIQLGLSLGSIIIECEEKSGSITQAKFCAQAKRPLFAVMPHHNDNPLNLLISGNEFIVNKLDAQPLRTKDDYPMMISKLKRQAELMSAL